MEIAILAFERITLLDAVGPYEVLDKLPGARVRWVGLEPGPVRSDGGLAIEVQARMEDVPRPDVVVVPGGYGTRRLLGHERVVAWLREVHAHSRYTTTVCTGSLLLGSAGLLEGLDATTHWARLDLLRQYGANPIAERVVVRDRIVTAAGVSAGIDMALRLVDELAGPEAAAAIQLGIEYDPRPHLDAGSPERVPPALRERVRAGLDAGEDRGPPPIAVG